MNFFALRDAIVEALKAALPNVAVLTADDLDGVQESDQPTPAVHVIYDGIQVLESAPSGKTAVVNQRWLVVSVIKHQGDRRKANREAGARVEPLINGVLGTLMGWRHATTGMRPLKLESPPSPAPRHPFFYFPLAFSADVTLERPR